MWLITTPDGPRCLDGIKYLHIDRMFSWLWNCLSPNVFNAPSGIIRLTTGNTYRTGSQRLPRPGHVGTGGWEGQFGGLNGAVPGTV